MPIRSLKSSGSRASRRWLELGLLLGTSCLGACSSAQSPARSPEVSPAAPGARPALPPDIVARSARPLLALSAGQKLAEPELWDVLSRERVICFGEEHSSPEHHFAQWRALQELAKRAVATPRPLAVGFEMFQRPYQQALTNFVTGALGEEQLLIESEYRARWGYDFSLYRPLLESAREYRLPALALNAPKEVTRKIGRAGLEALDHSERSNLPELDLANADHKAYFDAAMREHPMPPGGPKLEDMYSAQVVWDETMAATAADWLSQAGAQAQLIVFAGSGHCHESAIPGRIKRRIGVDVASLTPVFEKELATFADRQRYDWLIILGDAE